MGVIFVAQFGFEQALHHFRSTDNQSVEVRYQAIFERSADLGQIVDWQV